jgi:hypothetical protein
MINESEEPPNFIQDRISGNPENVKQAESRVSAFQPVY